MPSRKQLDDNDDDDDDDGYGDDWDDISNCDIHNQRPRDIDSL